MYAGAAVGNAGKAVLARVPIGVAGIVGIGAVMRSGFHLKCFIGCGVVCNLCWFELGVRKEISHSILGCDSVEAVRMVTSKDPPAGNLRSLVNSIKMLCDKGWEVVVKHVFREADKCVVANSAMSYTLGFQELEGPLQELLD
ncbi:hypothetical protein GH714_011612 [Hevea brasiliensis]|uniref:RNase H type-1 domain-containing protein n=1 Tax=Hevea brasiliensis TaxID=3981 RepID=A0A6A6LJ49_HEVBR|nr:hypothetical protein GH714_011612 [Hevea brasiliensis]